MLQPFTVTMTGSAVQATAARTPAKYIRIESEAANAIVYYGKSDVTTADYAGTVLANTATVNNGVIIGPFSGEYNTQLDEWWFIGTNAQKIHLTVIG